MKTKFLSLALVPVVAVIMSSCGTTSISSYTSRVTTISDKAEINPLSKVVDIRVDFNKRIVEKSQPCNTVNDAKTSAQYQAIINNKIDIVVDPIYKLTFNGSYYVAELTGFAGYYENARSIYDELGEMKNISKEDIEKYLMLYNPSVLKYLKTSEDGSVVNIYHNSKESKPTPAPAPAKKK